MIKFISVNKKLSKTDCLIFLPILILPFLSSGHAVTDSDLILEKMQFLSVYLLITSVFFLKKIKERLFKIPLYAVLITVFIFAVTSAEARFSEEYLSSFKAAGNAPVLKTRFAVACDSDTEMEIYTDKKLRRRHKFKGTVKFSSGLSAGEHTLTLKTSDFLINIPLDTAENKFKFTIGFDGKYYYAYSADGQKYLSEAEKEPMRDYGKAQEVSDLINSLGEITTANKQAVEFANAQFELLNEPTKELVQHEYVLKNANKKIYELEEAEKEAEEQARKITDMINESGGIAGSNIYAVQNARKAYLHAPEKVRELITNEDILINAEAAAGTAVQEEAYVYVSESGSKYHTQSCPYLGKNGRPVPLSHAASNDKEPCIFCMGKGE